MSLAPFNAVFPINSTKFVFCNDATELIHYELACHTSQQVATSTH
jgi:hypothetical protein